MPSSTATIAPDATPIEPDVVEWIDWPARQRPLLASAVVSGVLLAGTVTGLRMHSIPCGLLVVALLGAVLTNYLLPVWYALTGEGVTVRGLGQSTLLKWSRIDAARFQEDQAVLLVMPDHRSAPREFRVRYRVQGAAVADPLRRLLLDAGVPLV